MTNPARLVPLPAGTLITIDTSPALRVGDLVAASWSTAPTTCEVIERVPAGRRRGPLAAIVLRTLTTGDVRRVCPTTGYPITPDGRKLLSTHPMVSMRVAAAVTP